MSLDIPLSRAFKIRIIYCTQLHPPSLIRAIVSLREGLFRKKPINSRVFGFFFLPKTHFITHLINITLLYLIRKTKNARRLRGKPLYPHQTKTTLGWFFVWLAFKEAPRADQQIVQWTVCPFATDKTAQHHMIVHVRARLSIYAGRLQEDSLL